MNKITVLFVGHGSRVSNSSVEFEDLVQRFQKKTPNVRVRFGFVELAKPAFAQIIVEEAARPECEKLIILPVFLFSSRHVKNDIPLMVAKIRAQHPDKEIYCSETMKAHPNMVSLVLKRILEGCPKGKNQDRTLLMVGRGASDPDSNGEFLKLSRLVKERGGFENVHSCFIGITEPVFHDALNLMARVRPKELIVFPYFLFQGRLLNKLDKELETFSKKNPWVKSHRVSYLGVDDLLVEYFFERFEEGAGLKKAQELACVNCHYRSEIGDVATKVKGVDALLWSVRHLYTHSQAKPHEFAHKPLKKHILVCENVDCAKRGSKKISSSLRYMIKEKGLQESMRVTKTSCMGRCGEAPSVVVYPDGVWYREMKPEDSQQLFEEHLLNDKILSDFVDDIMM